MNIEHRTAPGGWCLRVDLGMTCGEARQDPWFGKSIAQIALACAREQPDLVIYKTARGDRTAAAVVAEAERLAGAMAAQGLGCGDTVAMMLPNWTEAAAVNIAAAWLGCVVTPIVPIYRDAETGAILDDARARLLFVPGAFGHFDYVDMARRLQADREDLRIVVVGGQPQGLESYHDWIRHEPIQSTPVECADAVKLLMYTSGTTGRAKGVLHTHDSLSAELSAVIEYWRIGSDDAIFMPSPVSHITGCLYALDLPFVARVACSLLERWDAAKAAEIIASDRCTLAFGATPFLQELLEIADQPKAPDLSSLRLWPCGGAAVPAEIIRRSNRVLPNMTACRIYGSTEVPTITLGVRGAENPHGAQETDGEVVVDARVVDAETGDLLPPGTVGEIAARAPEMFLGYSRPEDNDSAFDRDGYFLTGDLGVIDADGMLTVTGRKKDLIIRGGENISPREVESVLLEHPAVLDAAVVAMPHARLGETGCAFVVLRSGYEASDTDLLSILEAQRMARQKLPERFERVPELPRTASGKVRKDSLRSRIVEILQQEGFTPGTGEP